MSDVRAPRRDQKRFRRRRSQSPNPGGAETGTAELAARQAAASRFWLYGRHAVAAALANPARRWRRLVVLPAQQSEAAVLAAGARAPRHGDGAAVRVADRHALGLLLPEGAVHQGLAIEVEPLPERDLDEVVQSAGGTAGRAIIIVLDRLSDPQNVGAVLRSAAAFGALAVVVPKHGAAPVSGALAKAASGALESVPLVRAVNLARALDRLKEAGFWICGLEETAPQLLSELEPGERVALVLGSEGGGMRRLVRERCDFRARLPTRAEQPSLNVSNAAAVALYELVRSRTLGALPQS